MDVDIKTFEDLECWKSATKLRKAVSKVIKTFPDIEKYELTSQMRRASRSVTHNIAEGYGRFHFRENAQFCRTSRGSVYELLDQILVAYDEEYIDKEKYDELRSMIFDCLKILNGYINYLIKADNTK
ncbi:four helix bundle protein [Flagellimonas sp.]|uniref:four helix bundle protein n=1 Tax=Flagellimonas sp. TaxID=2058762 RepID=UPI003B530187